jgi:glucokinase
LRLGEPDCPSSILKQIPAAEITSKVVAEAAAKGDKVALDVLNFTGAVLGRACANFVAFSAPEAIILFGGLAKAGDLLLRPLREAFEADLLFLYKGRVSVLLSSLKEADAALLGASAIAWECDHSTIKV